ncbi:MAG TPA: DUF4350 domain-containing protein [Thermomicrobiales bacterium]|nr:DUF4350 domain-containing protein [Thermomicrobiales bacterium]
MNGLLSSYRWIIALVGGLLLLGVLAVAVYEPEPGEDTGPALRTSSNRSSGARALVIWLSDLGYDTRAIRFRQFSIDPTTRALFVLQPTHVFSSGEIDEVQRWVERGGTLVIASSEPNGLMDAYDVGILRQRTTDERATPLQPVFAHLPVESVDIAGHAWLQPRDPAWVPLLAAGDGGRRVVLASRAAGEGTVYALSDPRMVSNESLGAADNAAVVLNLLAGIPPGSAVAFDEYHQGLTEHGTLTARLSSEPWGWTIIYASLLALLYLAFSGRRFGRATPGSSIAALRSRAEYVATMGALLRRGSHHDWLRREYATHVKRALGARFRVRADQPAREFAGALSDRGGDAAALGPLLERLESPSAVGEQETVALMREVDAIQKRMTGQ